jgi:hypothetical protein
MACSDHFDAMVTMGVHHPGNPILLQGIQCLPTAAQLLPISAIVLVF